MPLSKVQTTRTFFTKAGVTKTGYFIGSAPILVTDLQAKRKAAAVLFILEIGIALSGISVIRLVIEVDDVEIQLH